MTSEEFEVGHIAAILEGIEETIIARMIDRAQFKANLIVYKTGQSGFYGEPRKCLFDIRLRYQEEMDARFGRFFVPEERPFNNNLPSVKREVHLEPSGLAIDDYDKVNLTGEILESYKELVAQICEPGDDLQYGSSVEHDVFAVQAISRRIHFGAFHVAESKYRNEPEEYGELINKKDTETILAKLTRKEVEDSIIERIREKAGTVQAKVNRSVRNFVDPGIIMEYYRDYIIPLTKKGEILYLMNRKRE